MIQRRFAVLALVIACGLGVLHASDWNALYARVDKVVLEPNPEAPQAIQVWGVFSMAKPDDRNDYLAAARGYLYFKLPPAVASSPSRSQAREDRRPQAENNAATVLKEWADLKDVAGTGQIVSFGNRHELRARLRPPDEKPTSPDSYSVNTGVTKVQPNYQNPPVRALLDFKS
jgi:hypothetical protein